MIKEYKIYRISNLGNEIGTRNVKASDEQEALTKYRKIIENEKKWAHPEAYNCIMYALDHNVMTIEEV